MIAHNPIRHSLSLALIACVAILTTTPAQAATVTWGAATTISGDADVSTAGVSVGAFDLVVSDISSFGPPIAAAPGDVIVNGVTFSEFLVSPPTDNVTVGNFTLSAVNGLDGNNLLGSANPPFANLSPEYQTLLRSAVGPAASALLTLTMSGLTVGNNYQFQFWTNNSTASAPGPFTATGGGGVVAVDPNIANADGGVGQFAIGTFIADNTSQQILFAGPAPLLNAFQLRDLSPVVPPGTAVPEPGSALVGLLALGVCGARLGRRGAR